MQRVPKLGKLACHRPGNLRLMAPPSSLLREDTSSRILSAMQRQGGDVEADEAGGLCLECRVSDRGARLSLSQRDKEELKNDGVLHGLDIKQGIDRLEAKVLTISASLDH